MEILAVAGSKVCCSLITVFYHSSFILYLIITYNIYLHHTGLLVKVHSKLQTFIKLCSLVNNKINHFYFLKLCFQLIYPVFIFCILKTNQMRYLEFEAKL